VISFPCTITDIFERKLTKHQRGAGPAAVFSTHSAGWYIQIDGAFSVFVGEDRPNFKVDDAVVLTLRKAT
jgi:hypothetical protein